MGNSPLLAPHEVVGFDGSEGGGEMVPDVHDGAAVDLRELCELEDAFERKFNLVTDQKTQASCRTRSFI